MSLARQVRWLRQALAERPGHLSSTYVPAGGSWREQLMARWVPPVVAGGLCVTFLWILWPLAVPFLLLLALAYGR